MTSPLALLKSRWFLTLVGTLVLSLLVWFAGALIAVGDVRPLEGDLARLAVAMALPLIWGAVNMAALMRSRRADRALVDGMTDDGGSGGGSGGGAGAGDGAPAAELAILKARIQDTIAVLKASDPHGGRGRRFLYQLPWYVMIGPPGSGKSTALESSGLVRQIAGQQHRGPRGVRSGVRGIGGTRNCEWLFTNDAILIDTAGRYTTQDSNETADAAAWSGFLDLLKRTRPRQPVNGVLVTISVGDLAGADEESRKAHARAVRHRLHELNSRFGLRLPAYVMLTKADLIAGFGEFFDDLGKTGREQVWGVTFPPGDDADPLELFDEEFDALEQRLRGRLLDRLQQVTDIERRGAIHAFPQQFATLKDPVRQFLIDAFEPSQYEHIPRLRGVYLTSGTQEGAPIDRLTASFARMIGADRTAEPARAGGGRAYFLTGLLRDVVYPEAGLVGGNPVLERRLRRAQTAGLAASVLVALAVLGLWTTDLFANRALIADADATASRFAEQVKALPRDPDRAPEPAAVLAPLDTLRGLMARTARPVAITPGLDEAGKLHQQAEAAYQRALNSLLLPPLTYRLEGQMRQNRQNADYLYEALKAYLMLTGRGPLDAAFVRQWLVLDLAALYPDAGPGAEAQREAPRTALSAHIDALLAAPLQPVTADLGLIDETQRQLAQYPLAARAYAHLKQSAAARALPEWRIIDVGGPVGARVFTRRSGKKLSEGIPGLYTREGFRTVMMQTLKGDAEAFARESWVLTPGGKENTGKEGAKAVESPIAGTLERDVWQLYLADYIAQWDAMLADLSLVPIASVSVAAQVAAELSGPESPLSKVLKAAAAQTTLAMGKPAAAEAGLDAAVAVRAPGADRLAAVVKAAGTVAAALPEPGRPVDDHFAAFHQFVEGRATVEGASLDDLIRLLNGLYGQLGRIQAGGSAAAPAAGGPSPAQQLAMAAARMPAPVAALATQMSKAGSAATVTNTRADLNTLWRAQVLPLCHQATENRYPIFKNSTSDVALADFAKLFAPNGLIDGFFNEHLRPYVDMSRQPWRWQKVDGVDLGIPAGVLVQFQRAMTIRDSLFTGGNGPLAQFELVQTTADADVTGTVLDIDGHALSFAPGASRPLAGQWPGGVGQTRLTLNGAAAPDVVVDGPWSLFRLIDRSRPTSAGGRERIAFTIAAGGRGVGFTLRTRTVLNPFTLRELGEFRCPGSL